MNDLILKIYGDYGLKGVIIAAIVLLVFVCIGLAMIPIGGELTWGPFKYANKARESENSWYEGRKFKIFLFIIFLVVVAVFLWLFLNLGRPRPFFVQPGYTEKNVNAKIQTIRSNKSLRELMLSESGQLISQIPPGTYFFTSSRQLDISEKFRVAFSKRTVQRYRSKSDFAEVQYYEEDDPNLILFVDEKSAAFVRQLAGDQNYQLRAATCKPRENNSVLLSLPISRIVNSQYRETDVSTNSYESVLDVTLR